MPPYHFQFDCIYKKKYYSFATKDNIALMNISSHFVTLSLHPLFWCTLMFMGGIALSAYLPLSIWTVSVIASLSFCSVILSYLLNAPLSRSLLLFFFMCLSLIAGALRFEQVQADHAHILNRLAQAPFDCTARVVDSKQSKKPFKNNIQLTLDTIDRHGVSQALKATISVHSIAEPDVLVGDRICVKNLKMKAPKLTPYTAYARKEGIHATLFIPRLQYTLIERPLVSSRRFRHELCSRVTSSLKNKLSCAAFSLLSALFIGSKPSNTTYTLLKQQCAAWGIVHYLARSGLHIVLIAASWNAFLRFIPMNFLIKQALLLILILLYHLITLSSVSFLRALITFILYKVCIFNSCSFKTLHILTLTTLLVLLHNPDQLFFLDFQLSFDLTFALAWFNELRIKIQRFYNIIENN